MCCHKFSGGLGFRSLRDFNLSLLAKHARRLITDESSLLARVLKARYYPSSSFFSAGLGANPSYTWRSILTSKEIVQCGCIWKIGSGSAVSV